MGTQKRKPNKKNKLIKGGTKNPLLPKNIVDLLNALFYDQNENENEIIEILNNIKNNINFDINEEIDFNKYFNDEYNNDDEYKKLRDHIERHSMYGDTTHLIILAIQLSTIKVMEKLIDMGAYLYVTDNNDKDPMYHACIINDDEKIQLLEDNGLSSKNCIVDGGKSRKKYKLKNKKIRRTTKRKTLKRKRNNKP